MPKNLAKWGFFNLQTFHLVHWDTVYNISYFCDMGYKMGYKMGYEKYCKFKGLGLI